MIKTDEYWAGQADGDGCFGFTTTGPAQRYTQVYFSFKTTHEATVRAFHVDMGVGHCGNASTPYSIDRGWKPLWRFKTTGEATAIVVKRLYPYLLEKQVVALSTLKYFRQEVPRSLPRTDAYWAGITDAEGCIRLSANNGAKRPEFTVKMTHEATIREMHQAMGVGIVYEHRPPSKRQYKTQWIYKAATRQACAVLLRLQPHLLTKAEDAVKVLAYYTHEGKRKDSKLTPDIVRAIRQRYAEGATRATLAKDYDAHWVTVDDVIKGRSWSWLT